MSPGIGIALSPSSTPCSSTDTCSKDTPSLLLTRPGSQISFTDHLFSPSPESLNSKLTVPLSARKSRHLSAPSEFPVHRQKSPTVAVSHSPETGSSFPTATSDDAGGEGDWMAPDPVFVVQRAVSVGSKQYGFTSLGRGFNWLGKEEEESNRIRRLSRSRSRSRQPLQDTRVTEDASVISPSAPSILGEPLQFEPEPRLSNSADGLTSLAPSAEPSNSTRFVTPRTASKDVEHSPLSVSPQSSSRASNGRSITPPSPPSTRPLISHSPTVPRPPSRRRSSHKRVSLVAGRVRVIEDMPALSIDLPLQLARTNSQSSFLSVAASTRPPSPLHDQEPDHFLGNHCISDYVIEGEAGRGAYGMVKRAREKYPDGKKGVSLRSDFLGSRLTMSFEACFDSEAGY